MFSLSFDKKTLVSKIDFGPWDKSQWLVGASIAHWSMPNSSINPYWMQNVDGFYFGNYPNSQFTTEAIIGAIDSGTPTIAGPAVNINFIK